MYHEYAFGAGPATSPDRFGAHRSRCDRDVERGQAFLTSALNDLSDADLDAPRMTNWGEEWPTWRVLWTMIDHDLHHGGEIGVLRDLYRERNMSTASASTSGA